eukprot:gene11817-13949_t
MGISATVDYTRDGTLNPTPDATPEKLDDVAERTPPLDMRSPSSEAMCIQLSGQMKRSLHLRGVQRALDSNPSTSGLPHAVSGVSPSNFAVGYFPATPTGQTPEAKRHMLFRNSEWLSDRNLLEGGEAGGTGGESFETSATEGALRRAASVPKDALSIVGEDEEAMQFEASPSTSENGEDPQPFKSEGSSDAPLGPASPSPLTLASRHFVAPSPLTLASRHFSTSPPKIPTPPPPWHAGSVAVDPGEGLCTAAGSARGAQAAPPLPPSGQLDLSADVTTSLPAEDALPGPSAQAEAPAPLAEAEGLAYVSPTKTSPSAHAPPLSPDGSIQRTGMVYDPAMLDHESGHPNHLEQPGRLKAIYERLVSEGLAFMCKAIPSHEATDEELLTVHSREHLDDVAGGFERSKAEDAGVYEDIYYSAGTHRAARLAAGCTVQATRSVLSGEVANAFAVVRPPGHHAGCCETSGFCFFNNVAVAAMDALRRGSAQRVLIVDWDVHHGNGTQDLLQSNPAILYISLHRYGAGFYPGTGDASEAGIGPGEGYSVNIPWRAKGMGNWDYAAAFEFIVMPIAKAFAPDLVLISAGFDAALGDPLGGMRVTGAGYAQMTADLLELAQGRCVVVLEGGYNEAMIATCVEAVVRVLLGFPAPALSGTRRLKGATEDALRQVLDVHQQYWATLRDPELVQTFKEFFADVAVTPNAANRRDAEKMMGNNLQQNAPSTSEFGDVADDVLVF